MIKGIDYPGVCVVFLCHDGQGNFLFNKRTEQCRDEPHVWDCGGGGLRFGEAVENALQREVVEEYCASIVSYSFLGYRDVQREHNGKKTHWIALDFSVHVDPSSVGIGEPHKMAEIGWFRLDALPSPLHSQVAKTFGTYVDRL